MSSLIRTPLEDSFQSLQGQVNRLFGSLLGEHLAGRSAGYDLFPAMDAFETPEAVVVQMEVPGVDPKSIDLSVTGDHLEIGGETAQREAKEDCRWLHRERAEGKFRRAVTLPVPVDAEKVEAETKHGLLTVRLPKRAEVMPRKISVKVH